MTQLDSHARPGPIDLGGVARLWQIRTGAIEKAHYRRCVLFRKRHVALGCVTIVCTTLLGIILNLHNGHSPIAPWLDEKLTSFRTEFSVILTVLAPVLTALVSFLRFDEKSNMHHNAGARFASMKRRLQLMISECASEGCDRKEVTQKLTEICEKWDALTLQAPALYLKEWKMIKEEIDKNEKEMDQHSKSILKNGGHQTTLHNTVASSVTQLESVQNDKAA
jgi:hypothetical protein